MTASSRGLDFLREVVVATLAQRVFATVTLLVLAGSTFTIVATAGRSAAAQEAVLSQIDAQGTRTIVVQAKGTQPGMTTTTVDSLARMDAVEAVVGLGPVTDATAAALPQGSRIGVRLGYGRIDGTDLLQPSLGQGLRTAMASIASTRVAGLPPGSGTIRLIDGEELHVTRTLDVPAYLKELEPLTLIPADRSTRHHPLALHHRRAGPGPAGRQLGRRGGSRTVGGCSSRRSDGPDLRCDGGPSRDHRR